MKEKTRLRIITLCLLLAVAASMLAGCNHGTSASQPSSDASKAMQANKDFAETREAWMRSHPGQMHP